MADAYSYLPGTTGDVYSRMHGYGSPGPVWFWLPGTVGDAWDRLIESILPPPATYYPPYSILIDANASWYVSSAPRSVEVTLRPIPKQIFTQIVLP